MNLQRRTEDHDDRFVSEYFVKSIVIGALLGGVGFLLWKLLRKLDYPVHPPIIIKSVDDSSDPIGIETDDPLQELRTDREQGETSVRARSLYRTTGFGRITLVRVFLRELGPWQMRPFETPNGCEVRMWLQYMDGGQWKDLSGGPHLTVFGTSSDLQLECEQLSPETNTGSTHRPRKRTYNKDEKWRIRDVVVVGHGSVSRGTNRKMEIWIDNT